MKVLFKKYNYIKERNEPDDQYVDSFIHDELFLEDRRRERSLEHKPTIVLGLVCRLLDFLLEKKLMTKEEFAQVVLGYSTIYDIVPDDFDVKKFKMPEGE